MVKTGAFYFKDDFPKRAMIGRIYRVETIGDGPRGRTSFEFDALDEARLEGGDLRDLFLSDDIEPFGLIRIVTTTARFSKLFESDPREGSWYRLQLNPPESLRAQRVAKVPAWHAQLTPGGYTRRSRGYVTSADFIGDDGDAPPTSLSAASTPAKVRQRAAIAVAQFSNFSPIDNQAVEALLRSFVHFNSIEVRDVGQANFITLYDVNNKPIVHYDAGWPVAFNGETVPVFAPVCQSVPVILSHWDWDHLSGYYRFPNLQKVKWIAPVQHLGIGASRIATRLDSVGLLFGFNGTPVSVNGLILGVCLGHSGSSNQTGLALRVKLPNRTGIGHAIGPRAALLTGDADYDNVPVALSAQPLDALLVTHHGANFGGQVPKGPTGSGLAIVSVGKGNRYKHPKARAIARHKRRGWGIRMTCAWAAQSRGSKWIR